MRRKSTTKREPNVFDTAASLLEDNVIKIEKDVPMPDKGMGKIRVPTENEVFLARLQPGDSFLIPAELGQTKIKYVMVSLRLAAKRLKVPLAQRLYENGLRVWRLEGEWKPRPYTDQLKKAQQARWANKDSEPDKPAAA